MNPLYLSRAAVACFDNNFDLTGTGANSALTTSASVIVTPVE